MPAAPIRSATTRPRSRSSTRPGRSWSALRGDAASPRTAVPPSSPSTRPPSPCPKRAPTRSSSPSPTRGGATPITVDGRVTAVIADAPLSPQQPRRSRRLIPASRCQPPRSSASSPTPIPRPDHRFHGDDRLGRRFAELDRDDHRDGYTRHLRRRPAATPTPPTAPTAHHRGHRRRRLDGHPQCDAGPSATVTVSDLPVTGAVVRLHRDRGPIRPARSCWRPSPTPIRWPRSPT